MADFCSLAQMCYAGRGTTAITDRSNQRSDPSHLKSLPEKSKPMLRVDLKAKISMAQWNGMNSFLNIKWTYFSWAQLHSYLWLYENWRNVSWCDHKQNVKVQKNMACTAIYFCFNSKKIRLSVKCMPKLEIVFGFSDTTTLIICTQNSR